MDRPVSILHKSIAGRYRFIKNASWETQSNSGWYLYCFYFVLYFEMDLHFSFSKQVSNFMPPVSNGIGGAYCFAFVRPPVLPFVTIFFVHTIF